MTRGGNGPRGSRPSGCKPIPFFRDRTPGERTHTAVIGVVALGDPIRGILNRAMALGAPIPVVRRIAGLGAGPLHPASDRAHEDVWPCRYAEAVVLGV